MLDGDKMIDPNTKRILRLSGKAKDVFAALDYLAKKENRFYLNGIGRLVHVTEIRWYLN